MEDKIYSYFEKEYKKIKVPKNLKDNILSRKRFFILAAVSSSLFIVFILSLFVEFSPTLDSIITNITLP